MLYIYQYLNRHRLTAGTLLFGLCAVFIFLATRIHYEEDIAKFLPHDAEMQQYQEVYEQFAQQDRIAVLFTSRDTNRQVSAERLEEAMETMGGYLTSSALIARLQVEVDEAGMMNIVDFVSRNLPRFLTPQDYRHADSLLKQPGYVAQQMLENKKLMMLPTAGVTVQTMRHDPLHLFTPALKRMQQFQLGSSFQITDGYLFTADGRTGLITMNSRFGSSETQRNAEIAELLQDAIQKTEKQYRDIRVSAIGAPLIAVTNAQQIKTDALIALAIASVLILAILIWHYRRLSYILWIGASVGFGCLFAIAGMALFQDEVSIIVLGIGSVIIGIAVNYPLHFLDHIREVSDRKTALKEMVSPLLIGNITTVAAFLCLVWLEAKAMRDLGIFGSLVLIGTLLFVFVFLPLYARSYKKAAKSTALPVSLGSRLHFPRALTRCAFPVVAILTLILGYFSLQTSFDSDLSHINYMTPEQRSDMQLLTSSMPASPVYAVATGKDLEAALRNNEELLKQLPVADSTVKGIGSFAPTPEKQRAALQRWRYFWQSTHPDIISEVRHAAMSQGFTKDTFAPFYANVQGDSLTVQPVSYFKPILQLLEGTYIRHQSEKVTIVNYLPSTANESQLRQVIGEHKDNYFVFSAKDVSSQLVRILNDSFNYIGFVCGFVVFFFLWLSFGKIELSLLSFLPLAVSWLWILGLMHIFDIHFNIVNIILATFIFGQGDDYTIFMTEGLLYEHATGKKRLASYRHSIAISAILMFIGIGSLIVARHPALRSLALVTILGMTTVVLMAYYLPPLVFNWLTMKKGVPREVPLTLKRLVRSVWALLFYLFMMFIFVLPFTWLYFHIGSTTERKRLRYHRLLYAMARFIVNKIPGVKFRLENAGGEQFDRPAIITCNHQSHFDTLCLMALHPKIIFLTNQWAWNNPLYRSVIHHAEFIPASDGMEAHLDELRSLFQRGYSICVFPEGTRTVDHRIHRFHKGAFYLAEQLDADIVPVVIHGMDHVLPKNDFMLREGIMTMRILKRIMSTDTVTMGNGYRERTRNIHQLYLETYKKMRAQYEDAHYYAAYLKYQYLYKGAGVERRCHRLLQRNNCYSDFIDAPEERGLKTRLFRHAGQCELPYLYALVHTETQVMVTIDDPDDEALVAHMAYLPNNFQIIKEEEQ